MESCLVWHCSGTCQKGELFRVLYYAWTERRSGNICAEYLTDTVKNKTRKDINLKFYNTMAVTVSSFGCEVQNICTNDIL